MMMLFIGGATIGLAIALLAGLALPSRPKLSPALARLGTTSTGDTSERRTLESRVGAWVIQRLPTLPGFGIPTRDLALVGSTANRFIYTKALYAAVTFVAFILLGIYAQILGVAPFTIPAILAVICAAGGWVFPDFALKDKAKKARGEFVRSISVFLELVAAERRRGAPPAIALETAASVGKSWTFVRMAQVLTRARYEHMQPWDALLELSVVVGVPEIAEAAKIVRLSGDEGAAVYESLRSSGQALRVRMLNEEHANANKASERITLMITCLAMIFTGILLTPLILKLT